VIVVMRLKKKYLIVSNKDRIADISQAAHYDDYYTAFETAKEISKNTEELKYICMRSYVHSESQNHR